MAFKIPKPKIAKPHAGKRLPHLGVKTAFGQGKTAFPPPSSPVVPDQAFQGAMGLPQGQSAPLEAPPSPPQG